MLGVAISTVNHLDSEINCSAFLQKNSKMRWGILVGLVLLIVILSGCKKEALQESDFIGNWNCNKYSYVYWNGTDSSFVSSKVIDTACYMNIDASNMPQFYMGIGSAKMPLLLNPDMNGSYSSNNPVLFDGPFAIQRGGDGLQANNNWDFMELTVEYGIERQLRATCQFKLIDKSHLNVKVLLRMTTGATHKYTYALLELSK